MEARRRGPGRREGPSSSTAACRGAVPCASRRPAGSDENEYQRSPIDSGEVAHRSTSVPSSWKGSLCFTTRTTQKTMIAPFSLLGACQYLKIRFSMPVN